MKFALPALALLATLAFATAPAVAEQVTYTASLTGTAETPPNDSPGNGSVEATYDTDTKLLTWTITYASLTGDADAAHFHGPAGVGEKAPPVVPIDGSLASPIKGSATLTDAQAADLAAGKWYFNIHTAKYPDGELRGQLMAGDASMQMSSMDASSMEMSSSSAM
jgi:hypothetical protein